MNIQKITEIFFLLTIASLPLYLLRFFIFFIPTNLLEVLAVISIFLFILEKKAAFWNEWVHVFKKIATPAVLLFAGLMLSFSVNAWTFSGLGIIKSWFIIPFLFSLSLSSLLNNEEKVASALKAFYFSIFLVSFLSLIYKTAGILTYDQRLSAFYLSPNHLAMFLSLGIFLFPYLILRERGRFMAYLLYICLFLIIVSLYFTFSYASWLAVFFSVMLLLFLKKELPKKTVLIFWAILLLCATFFISQYNESKLITLVDFRSSLSSRIMIWESSLKIAQNNPILGIGPGNFQASYLEYQKYFPPYLEWAVPQPHNIYLAFYLQAGLVGLVGFLMTCYYWLRFSLKLRQKNTLFMVASLGILFYILIHGLVDTPYWKNDLAFSFWIIFFLTISIANQQRFFQKSSL